MSNLFALSRDELISLLSSLKPELTPELHQMEVTSLRTKVTEWLFVNGLSTLHRFSKTEGNWNVPDGKLDCNSCKKFKSDHTYAPSLSSPLKPVINGDTFITFDVKSDLPLEKRNNQQLSERESISSKYYSSMTDCLAACVSCVLRPLMTLIEQCTVCCGDRKDTTIKRNEKGTV